MSYIIVSCDSNCSSGYLGLWVDAQQNRGAVQRIWEDLDKHPAAGEIPGNDPDRLMSCMSAVTAPAVTASAVVGTLDSRVDVEQNGGAVLMILASIHAAAGENPGKYPDNLMSIKRS